MRFMAVEQDDPLGGLSYHSPRQETGQAGHVSSEHAAVVAHPTVTEVLAGVWSGRGRVGETHSRDPHAGLHQDLQSGHSACTSQP